MAYATKYRIEFKDVLNNLVQINLQPKNYFGAIIELTGSGTPLLLTDPNQDFMQPVRGTGATIEFYNNGHDLTDLYTLDPFGIQVWITYAGAQFFHGFLNTGQFSEDYTRIDGLVSLIANDGLAALKRAKYFNDVTKPYQKGRETIKQVLLNCVSPLVFDYFYLYIDFQEQNHTSPDQMFSALMCDTSNFIDDDGISLSKRDVLESIMLAYNLTLVRFANTIFIYTPKNLANGTVIFKLFPNNWATLLTNSVINNKLDFETHYKFIHADARKTMESGFNKLEINYIPRLDIKKILPFDADFSTWADDFTGTYWVDFPFDDDTGYWWRYSPTTSFLSSQSVQVVPTSGGYLMQVVEGEAFTGPGEEEWKKNTYLVIKNLNTANENQNAIKIEAGYINKNVFLDNYDNINIRFKVKTLSPNKAGAKVHLVRIPFTIQIGSKFGRQEGSGKINVNRTSAAKCYVFAIDTSQDIQYTEIEATITIRDIAESGLLKLNFNYDCKLYHYYEGNWTLFNEFDDSPNSMALLYDFQVLYSYAEPPDTEILFEGITDADFEKDEKLEVSLSGKIQGRNNLLDRGVLTLASGAMAEYFKLTADSSYIYSLLEIMLRYYLSQFKAPFRRITGTIKHLNAAGFIRNGTSMNNIIAPFSVIRNSAHESTRCFYLVGYTFDVRRQELEGTFDEIKTTIENI